MEGSMDAITAAVALLNDQVAVQRMDFAAKMVKSADASKQGILDLITASSDAGALYSPSGSAVSGAVGARLNTTA